MNCRYKNFTSKGKKLKTKKYCFFQHTVSSLKIKLKPDPLKKFINFGRANHLRLVPRTTARVSFIHIYSFKANY